MMGAALVQPNANWLSILESQIQFGLLHAEALTCGDSWGEALENAGEVMELVLGDSILNNQDVPEPSRLSSGLELVAVRPAFAAKLALHAAMRQQGITREELAARLGVTHAQVHDMLDPYGETPLARTTLALQVTGRRLILEDAPADGGEHFCQPALSSGSLSMNSHEFIRRIRRHALANQVPWRLEDEGAQDNLGTHTMIRVSSHATPLPEEDELTHEDTAALLGTLGINEMEF